MTAPGSGPGPLRKLSLRTKLAVTVVAALVAVLGATSWVSFRFWEREGEAALEKQALLAAGAARAAVEAPLRAGRKELARSNLERLLEGGGIHQARVWSSDHTVLLSSDPSEEGPTDAHIWIPDPSDLTRPGLVRLSDGVATARAYVPLTSTPPTVLEVEIRDVAGRAALQRGGRLAIGLTAMSVLAVVLMVGTMFEREVVGPIHRVEHMLPDGAEVGGHDEVGALEDRVARLVQREQYAEALAEERDRELHRQDGLARVGGLAAEMAHEFKRPLASIRTAVGVLEDEYALQGRGRETLEAVNVQLERLSETMNDLFTLARPVELEAVSVEVASILDEAVYQLSGLTDTSGLSFERDYPSDLWVHGDARRLVQAVLNLMTNAVEAMNGQGKLVVAAERVPDDAIRITVSDTGPGLDPEEARRVLTPFYSTKPFGTGLGLSVVARVVEAHRGRLDIEGGDGGTTVRVILPAAAGAEAREVS